MHLTRLHCALVLLTLTLVIVGATAGTTWDESVTKAFVKASLGGQVERVRSYLQNSKVNVNARTDGGSTVLHELVNARENDKSVAIVELLLKHPRVNPNDSPKPPAP